jgi:hypothetical protein
VGAGQRNIDLHDHTLYSRHALRGAFGSPFLGETFHVAGQCHDAILCLYADPARFHFGLPLELVQHVLLQLIVGFHMAPRLVSASLAPMAASALTCVK